MAANRSSVAAGGSAVYSAPSPLLRTCSYSYLSLSLSPHRRHQPHQGHSSSSHVGPGQLPPAPASGNGGAPPPHSPSARALPMDAAPEVSLEAAPAARGGLLRGCAGAAGLSQPTGLGGRLVVRNTFLHFQEYEEERRVRRLFRIASAPELPLPPRGPEAPRGQPPSSSGAEWRTTVLLRNVPYPLTRDMLVELLDAHGFRGQFDLVYVPRDFKTNQTFGYAFVNALTSEIAARIHRSFEGFQAWPVKSQKKCSAGWSNRQGLQSNVAVYRNLTVMKGSAPEDWKPALFLCGSQVAFPAPTRKSGARQMRPRHRPSAGGGAAQRLPDLTDELGIQADEV
ncbi:unnamed protein product [Prorocentrum cordatum]|uniref:RRM domain-containing protein n=1 Tax=Prorocentrum cordatum TaxID=2364126 RepID=A0ABN9WSE6_9DINO|nr:unnamed protein product [Polarella glacialis]